MLSPSSMSSSWRRPAGSSSVVVPVARSSLRALLWSRPTRSARSPCRARPPSACGRRPAEPAGRPAAAAGRRGGGCALGYGAGRKCMSALTAVFPARCGFSRRFAGPGADERAASRAPPASSAATWRGCWPSAATRCAPPTATRPGSKRLSAHRRRADEGRRARPRRAAARDAGLRHRLPHRGLRGSRPRGSGLADQRAVAARSWSRRRRPRAWGGWCSPPAWPRSARPARRRGGRRGSTSTGRRAPGSPTRTRSTRERPEALAAAARLGVDLVVVNPAYVLGVPVDRSQPGETSTRVPWPTTCSAGCPAVVDGATNIVDVEDVARGHLLAAERGRARRALHPRRLQPRVGRS